MKRRKAPARATARAVTTGRAKPCDGLAQATTPRFSVPQRAAAALPVDRIVVGERHRKDLGDLSALSASMAELGLLHPVVVTPAGVLIAGERRLRAAKLLSWTSIPVTVVDIDEIVRGEHAENAVRKDFTLSEAVAIKRALEPAEREAAQERMRTGKPLENFSEGSGRALDKIAKVTGVSRITLARAEAVVDAAERDPKYAKLREDMDRTGRVNGVYRRLKIAQQAEIIRAEPPPLPGRGPYRCAVVDFPWTDDTGRNDPSHDRIAPYPPMTLEEICAFPLTSILASDAIVWLWFTNYHVTRGIHCTVLDAHDLKAKAMLTWGKPHFGVGDWLRSQTEQCILAVRGNPVVTLTDQSTLLLAPPREVGGHSLKPREFYDLVESLCPAPRATPICSRATSTTTSGTRTATRRRRKRRTATRRRRKRRPTTASTSPLACGGRDDPRT